MSIVQAPDAQFKLGDDGGVYYQKLPNNPMPGEQVAMLVKGGSALKPGFSLVKADALEGVEEAQAVSRIQDWLDAHIKATLELLVNLAARPDELPAPVHAIAEAVHASMGIVPREELEATIADLDVDMRKELRALRIRLGPILVFIPALSKPAAVRLRAILWGVYHDKDLPMEMPKEGIVSFEVDPAQIDKSYYQAIGYPVFGRRAIRIDMLDRVISAVYDAADKGKFKAQHKMAEWLGSTIEGLYDVLTAMGHTKIFDPADERTSVEEAVSGDAPIAAEPETAATSLEDLKAAEGVMVSSGAEAVAEEKTEAKSEEKTDEKAQSPSPEVKPQDKPELATFRLKKGKAFEKSSGGGKRSFNKDKKPYNKDKPKFKDGPHGKKHAHKKKGDKPQDRGPRVIKAEAEKKPEDSPFAVLQQLKK